MHVLIVIIIVKKIKHLEKLLALLITSSSKSNYFGSNTIIAQIFMLIIYIHSLFVSFFNNLLTNNCMSLSYIVKENNLKYNKNTD